MEEKIIKKKHIDLPKLDIYIRARKLSEIGWKIYEKMSWQEKKVIGDQFIRSTDSVGANIAEGYARFHYLDRVKFMYNARGSLAECADHWLELLNERQMISQEVMENFKEISNDLFIKLNNFIRSIYKTISKK